MKKTIGLGFIWKPESKDYVMLGRLISGLYRSWYISPKTAGIEPPALKIEEDFDEVGFSLVKRIEVNEEEKK